MFHKTGKTTTLGVLKKDKDKDKTDKKPKDKTDNKDKKDQVKQ